MPYTIRKLAKKNCYKVMNKKTKRVFAKCTTKEKAKKQLRLLNAIEYNPNFVSRGRVRNGGGSQKNKKRTYKNRK
jgi:hypothetical protein